MPIKSHSSARRRQTNKEYETRRGSARDRGYSTRWDKFARVWLVRNPLCVYCAAQGRVTAAELVDHIVPHASGAAPFWPDEHTDPHAHFASCCRACHDGPKQSAERAAVRRGIDVRVLLARKVMLRLDHPALRGVEVDRITHSLQELNLERIERKKKDVTKISNVRPSARWGDRKTKG